ncbi:MAG: acylphosphatase, partial [Smithella sp.]
MAVKNGLTGFVQNRPEGVIAEAEGSQEALENFLACVKDELPPLAHITKVESSAIEICNDDAFKIISSVA